MSSVLKKADKLNLSLSLSLSLSRDDIDISSNDIQNAVTLGCFVLFVTQ